MSTGPIAVPYSPAHQAPALAEGVDVLGEQGLEVRFDAVLLESGVLAELMGAVLEDLVQTHAELVTGLVMGDVPLLDPVAVRIGLDLVVIATRGAQRAGRSHPVQRFIAASVRMDQHAAIGFDDQQARSQGEVGGESTGVVDRAAGNDETHPDRVRHGKARRLCGAPSRA